MVNLGRARLFPLFGLLVLWSAATQAQTLPEGLLDQPRPSDVLPPLPEPEPPKPRLEYQLPPVLPPVEDAPLSAGPRFLLTAVRFAGNQVFTDQEFDSVAAPFLDRLVSAEDLENLRRLVTLHYVEAGYINSAPFSRISR